MIGDYHVKFWSPI